MSDQPLPPQQAQSFRDIHVEGQGHSLIINQIVQIAPEVVQAQPFVERSPYVGLRRFEERDQDLFFGRDAVVAKLLAAVRERRLTLVAGASGSGKSSLVQAGLLPILQRRMARLRVLTLVPDRDPFARLQAALLHAGFDLDQVAPAAVVSDETLLSLCNTLRAPNESWLIVLDQFEEIFTLCADVARRKAFLDGLCRLIDSGPADVKLMIAMRSDFFDRFDPHPRLLERAQPPFFITSPSPEELRLCIEQPAARHGVTFEAGLVSEILRCLEGQPGTLPLLSYTLDLLWKKNDPKDDRTLKSSSYRTIGGITGALKQRAEELYDLRGTDRQRSKKEPREPAQREAMRRLFLRLLDLSEQSENARPISKRTPLSEFPPDEQALIAELADEKLLVTNRREDVSTVEVAHESLLSAWPRLGEWIAEAREAIYARNRLQADADVWGRTRQADPARAEDELWIGTRLQTALEQEERGDFARLGGLASGTHDFLKTSRDLRDRRAREEQNRRDQLAKKELEKQQQRTRFLRIGVVLMLLFGLAAGGIAGYARLQQGQAEQRELDLLVEQGRQLLVEKGKPLQAALVLHSAQQRGSQAPLLPFLVRQAMFSIDASRQILGGHTNVVNSAIYSPDGRHIVTASCDKTARLWDAQTGTVVLSLQGHMECVGHAAYSPDGRWIVTSSHDQTARIWDAQTGKHLRTLNGHTGKVNSAEFSPDGRWIVTASHDKTARVWDVQTGRLLRTLAGHEYWVISAAFSPDGHRIVTASWDSTAQVWDVQTGIRYFALKGHASAVNSAAFSPDGRRIVTASHDQTARIWDAQTGAFLLALQGHSDFVMGSTYSPDGRWIATASWDHTTRVWDAETGTLRSLQEHAHSVVGVAYSPDGRWLVAASWDRSAYVWDASSGPLMLAVKGHTDEVTSAAYSPDGRCIVTASRDKTAKVWDVQTGALIRSLRGHASGISSAAYSPDGQRIATASWDKTAKVWDAASGALLLTVQGHAGALTSIEYSPDGLRIVTASGDKTAKVWDAVSGALLVSLPAQSGEVNSADYSPDGRHIVTADNNQGVKIWDAQAGTLGRSLVGHAGAVLSAKYDPSGRHIVTASEDQTARVWDAETGTLLRSLKGQSAAVLSARYSPDGRRIITGSDDKTARVWEAASGTLLLSLNGHMTWVTSVAYSPDGRHVITTSKDKTAKVWNVEAETRGLAELRNVLNCRVPLRLQGTAVLPAELDPTACSHMPSPVPLPLSREHAESALWAGVYASQAGHKEGARVAFQHAHQILARMNVSGDEEISPRLDLAEADNNAPTDANCPPAVISTLRQTVQSLPIDAQTLTWTTWAGFAQAELYRPRWAMVLLDEAMRQADDATRVLLRALKLSALLSTGQSGAVQAQGPTVWAAQKDAANQTIVAGLIWLAAGHAPVDPVQRRIWASRAMEHYIALPENESLGWTFNGSRHYFLNQPDSPLRTQALELFTLLEERKTAETTQKFSTLLGIPSPKVAAPLP